MTLSATPLVESFFDTVTSTFTYVLHTGADSECAIIDSVLDFDPSAARTHTRSADAVIAFVREHRLRLRWLLETHAHADHLSAAPYIQGILGGTIAIGSGIRKVQQAFQRVFHLAPNVPLDGSQFGHLFEADEAFSVGPLQLRAMHVPGHTPADIAYVVAGSDGHPSMAFVGDTLFMPDVGSARCDFPGGNAHTLYQSVQRILALPPETVLLLCHDYPPAGRMPSFKTTVAEQRLANIHLRDAISEQQFVDMREKRDATLGMPALILPAIQVNIQAGELPEPEANGVRYLKVPLNIW
ncbi:MULTISPECIES: MBL fold metallo-hydrolase [unclassified Acidovorax]|uniref:MBL fold metallo-hydrolase n=1 Tax=unclassified Acidovorax TaxID=2684926 RepID=UPI0028834623|nr:MULTISPECIES: MBL fold metallo-hydrolase [unclassified Acidovorax]